MPVRKKRFVLQNGKFHTKKCNSVSGTICIYYNSKLSSDPIILSCTVDFIKLGDSVIYANDIRDPEWWEWISEKVCVAINEELSRREEEWRSMLRNNVFLEI